MYICTLFMLGQQISSSFAMMTFSFQTSILDNEDGASVDNKSEIERLRNKLRQREREHQKHLGHEVVNFVYEFILSNLFLSSLQYFVAVARHSNPTLCSLWYCQH